ncbi:MAG: hypothetical protein QXZ17_15110, partial [Nitrososphaerota archaeon]
MVTERTRERTRNYALSEQRAYLERAQQILDNLKNSETLMRTISAYKGLITRQHNIIKTLSPKKINEIHAAEGRIARYERISANLELISRLPKITDYPSLEKTINDLSDIAKTDVSFRGARKISDVINGAILNLEHLAEGVEITNSILDNIEADSDVMIPILIRFRNYLKAAKSPTKTITLLIRAWRRVSIRFQTLVWQLTLNTETGKKHGKPNTSESPGGTYVLFNIDMNSTNPKKLFGTMINPDKANEKENIYYWFRRKFASNWSDREWAEAEKSLEIGGFGYV